MNVQENIEGHIGGSAVRIKFRVDCGYANIYKKCIWDYTFDYEFMRARAELEIRD